MYCEDTEVANIDTEWKGYNPENFVMTSGVTRQAVDAETAKQLWTLSEELTGVKFSVE